MSYFVFQCRTKGGAEGHVQPEEALSALKKKHIFFHVLLKEKVGRGGTDRAVTPACK